MNLQKFNNFHVSFRRVIFKSNTNTTFDEIIWVRLLNLKRCIISNVKPYLYLNIKMKYKTKLLLFWKVNITRTKTKIQNISLSNSNQIFITILIILISGLPLKSNVNLAWLFNILIDLAWLLSSSLSTRFELAFLVKYAFLSTHILISTQFE